MQPYLVSARKYRPSTFESVVGQSHITQTLKNAIKEKKLAHAFLFCGPRGVGKTTCARILAKTINCTNLTKETEACNQCESCLSFQQSLSFNIHELDAASHNSVEDIRNLVDQVRYLPQGAKYKIYIIDEVHMLSQAAFNAFLKTLEEPPSYAIFILATTEKHKIIPTILSRCQIFDFNRINPADITSRLSSIAEKESVEAESEGLFLIAQKSDGSLRDALSIFDQINAFTGKKITYKSVTENLNILDYDYYFKITQAIWNEDIPEILLTLEEILKHGFNGGHFIGGLGEHLRNLLVCKDPKTLSLFPLSDQVKDKYLKQAKEIDAGYLLTALNISDQCDFNYKTSRNQRLHVELALLKMAYIRSAVNISQKSLHPTSINTSISQSSKSISTAEKKKVEPLNSLPKTEKQLKTSEENLPLSPSPSPANNSWKNLDSVKEAIRKKTSSAVSDAEKSQTIISSDEKESPSENIDNKLAENWKSFAEELNTKGMMLDSAMFLSCSAVWENNQIVVLLENPMQEDRLKKIKPDLVTFMRKKFEKPDINITWKIREIQKEKTRPYTSREKFEYLATKNPELLTLQNRLGLDLDY